MIRFAMILFVILTANAAWAGAETSAFCDLQQSVTPTAIGDSETSAESSEFQSFQSGVHSCERRCQYWYRHCADNCTDPSCDQSCRLNYRECLNACDNLQ